jgi:hypothetical protein
LRLFANREKTVQGIRRKRVPIDRSPASNAVCKHQVSRKNVQQRICARCPSSPGHKADRALPDVHETSASSDRVRERYRRADQKTKSLRPTTAPVGGLPELTYIRSVRLAARRSNSGSSFRGWRPGEPRWSMKFTPTARLAYWTAFSRFGGTRMRTLTTSLPASTIQMARANLEERLTGRATASRTITN